MSTNYCLSFWRKLMFLAGLYRLEERDGLTVPVFTVLTKEPTEELRRIHDRMPVILPQSAVGKWIEPSARAEDCLQLALSDVLAEPCK